MFKKLKCAVVGVGSMGKNHARIYSEVADLVAISDVDTVRGQQLAAVLNTKFYSNYQEMLDKEDLDAVSVTVPTIFHKDIAIEFLKNKIPVLVEKPISNTTASAEEILKTAQDNDTLLMVGHIERYNPAVLEVKKIIKDGTLGKLTSIIARRVGGFPPQIRDVDISVDLAIHDIDIVNYLIESTPSRVIVNKQKNHIQNREDSVEFFMLYDKVSAFVQANWITPVKIRKLNITGTEGYLEMDYINQQVVLYKSIYEKFKVESGDFSDFILKFSESEVIKIPIKKEEPLKNEIQGFLQNILDNTKIDSNYALDALKIALKN